jgi:hypothetical protein
MKRLIITAVIMLCAATWAIAGNVHRDGAGVAMPDVFAPIKGTSVTHTKADVTYTPTAGTKVIRFQAPKAITYKINGTGTGYPVASAANEGPIGIATRTGVGVVVSSIVFTGASSASVTIPIQEQ